ncbi:MAG: sulfatase-like hydrolase/transferase [Coraliomargaritaceae bacterium]
MKLAFCLFGFVFFSVSTLFARAEKPNIIIFLVDDMGLMDCSVPFLASPDGQPIDSELHKFYQTPAMESLASRGIRFSDFYVHSVCSPTRVSLMTGQNSARHRTTQWINPTGKTRDGLDPIEWNWMGLQSADVTLPRLLQNAGYKTLFIGKAHFGPIGSEGADPLNLGFDVNVGGTSWGRPKSYYGRDHFGNHPKYLEEGNELTHHIPHLEEYYADDLFLSEALTREAMIEVDQAIAEAKPFYLQMSHYAVHSPFQPDPRFAHHYAASMKNPKLQAYATLVAGIDQSLADLLHYLEERGVAEDTLIFFLGDNGSDAPMGDPNAIRSSAPLRGKKATRWEGGMRVPFIAAWALRNPQNRWQRELPIPAGSITPEMGVCYDLFPTILDLLDLPLPSGHTLDGQNLRQRLLGQKEKQYRNRFLNHYPHRHRNSYFTSLRVDQWKLIYNYQPSKEIPRYQLYDLKKDLSESNNLAKLYPKQLRIMMKTLVEELLSMSALYPVDAGQVLEPVIP